MKVKTVELSGGTLDWAVAKCKEAGLSKGYWTGAVQRGNFTPSTDWAQAGPIIEQENIFVMKNSANLWVSIVYKGHPVGIPVGIVGPTPLIAAMRCYVASKLGDEVEIPDELI